MKRFLKPLLPRLMLPGISIAGVLLRLKLYLENRSFWLDEAWLALDVSLRSVTDILSSKVLAGDIPIVPMGFALAERLSITVWHNHEYALRLFPLICGIGAVWFFYVLTKKWLEIPGRFLAGILFSFSWALILYSTELKQYSTDLAAGLGLYALYSVLGPGISRTRFFLFWCLAGMLALFFSYNAVFVLAGIALVQIIHCLRMRDAGRWKTLAGIYVFWLTCLGYFHGGALRVMLFNPTLIQGATARRFFPPAGVFTWDTVVWAGRAVYDFVVGFLGLEPGWAAGALFAAGGAAFFRVRRKALFLLSFPPVLALAGALLHVYPFGHRFLLFTAPFVFILVGAGFDLLWRSPRRMWRMAGIVLAVAVTAGVAGGGTRFLFEPYDHGQYRSAIRHLNRQARPGDVLYLNHSAKYLYGYYIKYDPLQAEIAPVGKLSDTVHLQEGRPHILRQFVWHDFSHPRLVVLAKRYGEVVKLKAGRPRAFGRNPRTWILLAHFQFGMKRFVLSLADRQGHKIDEYKRGNVELYLYDFNN